MNYEIKSSRRCGQVTVPSSKSYAHRALICAALTEGKNTILCEGLPDDISATVDCLNALGAKTVFGDNRITAGCIQPLTDTVRYTDCGESGSTLRFLLPVAAAIGGETVFNMRGRLPGRPVYGLVNALEQNGVSIEKNGSLLKCSGRLRPGSYTVPGDVSSQFISGLLFALPLLPGDSEINITGSTESLDYIKMTEEMIKLSGIKFEKKNNGYLIYGNQSYRAPECYKVERDWSGASFFLCMGALSEKGITVRDMNISSVQGDRRITDILRAFGAKVEVTGNDINVSKGQLNACTVDARNVPDLVPVIAALAAGANGITEITNASRLRFKESDRLSAVSEMLNGVGAQAIEKDDGLLIYGKPVINGGTVNSYGDHRIAMAAALLSFFSKGKIEILNADCTAKSFPGFWEEFESLEAEV